MLVTVPFRRIVNVTTTRGADDTLGSTVDCSQLLLMRRCTASTYHEKREPKSPPAVPVEAQARLRGARAHRERRVGNRGRAASAVGNRVRWRRRGILQNFRRLRYVFRRLVAFEFGIGTASGSGLGTGFGSALKSPFELSTTRFVDSTSGEGSGIAGTFPTSPRSLSPRSAPVLVAVRINSAGTTIQATKMQCNPMDAIRRIA